MNEVILALAKHRPEFLCGSDDPERNAINLNFFVKGIDIRKELIDQILAHETHHRLVSVVGIVDVAALIRTLVCPMSIMLGVSPETSDLVNGVSFVTRLIVGTVHPGFGADVLITLQVVAQEFEILNTNGLVTAPRLQPRLVSLGPLELVDDEDVGPQVGDVIGDVEVHAVDDRHHDNECRGGNHHAQQGEERTKLVRA